jgi:hypothetical protein
VKKVLFCVNRPLTEKNLATLNGTWIGTLSYTSMRTSLAWPSRCGSDSPTCICAMWKLEYTQNTSNFRSLGSIQRISLARNLRTYTFLGQI